MCPSGSFCPVSGSNITTGSGVRLEGDYVYGVYEDIRLAAAQISELEVRGRVEVLHDGVWGRVWCVIGEGTAHHCRWHSTAHHNCARATIYLVG